MVSIAVQSTFTLPSRADIVSRLATSPPLEQLLTSDDIERQHLIARQPLKPAAVLLLVVNHPGDPTVVFTQRNADLADHAGQISFPGGRCDEAVERAHGAARAEEEVGIPASVSDPGPPSQYLTSTATRHAIVDGRTS